MIYQISKVKTQTKPLPQINKGLIQARHIQIKVKERAAQLPMVGYILSPMTGQPYLVPVTRWIE